MDKWEAQYKFWSGFGVPAYEQNSVPDADHVVFPYITYEAASSAFNEEAYPNASIYTRSTSWEEADRISDLIETRLKNGGYVIKYDGGGVWFTIRPPFSQSTGDPNDNMIKRKLISVTLHF